MVDWTALTPCQLAAALKQAYYDLLTGQKEEVVRARGPNAEDEVKFTKANINDLWAQYVAAQAECDGAGVDSPTRRRAFRLGSRQRSS
jgi:hypothetical protein